MAKGINYRIDKESYSFWSYIIGRLQRLFPLLVIQCGIALIIGTIIMLPDDLENLGQSVIATIFFANNILADITTKNYWDLSNAFKPLMHTWYLGILMQGYVFLL